MPCSFREKTHSRQSRKFLPPSRKNWLFAPASQHDPLINRLLTAYRTPAGPDCSPSWSPKSLLDLEPVVSLRRNSAALQRLPLFLVAQRTSCPPPPRAPCRSDVPARPSTTLILQDPDTASPVDFDCPTCGLAQLCTHGKTAGSNFNFNTASFPAYDRS